MCCNVPALVCELFPRLHGNFSQPKTNTNEAYFKRYRLFAMRYSRKIGSLRKKLRLEHAEYSVMKTNEALYKEVGTLQTRTYGRWTCGGRYKLSQKEAKAQKKALQAGEMLRKLATEALGHSDYDLKELDMATLEVISRNLSIYPDSDYAHATTASTVALKRFFKNGLGKSDKDLEDFAIHRRDHHIELMQQARKERAKEEGRNSRSRKKTLNACDEIQ